MLRFLEILVALLSIGLQGFVVYYGYKLYKLMKPIKYWTTGWGLFCIAMLAIVLRRCFTTYQDIFIACPTSLIEYFFEYLLLITISLLLILFVYKLKNLFVLYINGGANVLHERENLLSKREVLVSGREKEITRRELALRLLTVEEPNGVEVDDPKKVTIEVDQKKVLVEKPKKVIVINPKKVTEA